MDVYGHSTVLAEILGAPNVRSIHLKTDKAFYRPGEVVDIRALPVGHEGTLYNGEVEFQLLDPSGFRIFNHTAVSDHRYIATSFQLPQYVRYGAWKVVASAGRWSAKFSTQIRVKEYSENIRTEATHKTKLLTL